MFSDVVLSPEAEYAKKINEKETRFGAREQKRCQKCHKTGTANSRIWSSVVPSGTYQNVS